MLLAKIDDGSYTLNLFKTQTGYEVAQEIPGEGVLFREPYETLGEAIKSMALHMVAEWEGSEPHQNGAELYTLLNNNFKAQ